MALHAFQERLIGHTVGLMSDNTTVMAYINKRGKDDILVPITVDQAGPNVDRVPLSHISSKVHSRLLERSYRPTKAAHTLSNMYVHHD